MAAAAVVEQINVSLSLFVVVLQGVSVFLLPIPMR